MDLLIDILTSEFQRKKMSSRKRLRRKTNVNIKREEAKNNNFGEITPLDFTTPKALFESFLKPVSMSRFFDKYWEKQPVHIPLSPERALYYDQLFSVQTLRNLLSQEELHFGYDVNAVRYVNNSREDLNSNGRMTVAKFDRLFNKEKGTIQFHQPQRFQDKLWQLLENLESFFGCLVGSNIYITPPGAQGLPPHHDDVEVFIIQLEGEKHWQLHKPLIDLPREYSRDLTASEIGEPTHNLILKPGDLLYFPRGTIHHAKTLANGIHSTHITISTYQKHTWGDYLMCVFPKLLEEAMSTDAAFRKGLPINFMASEKLAQSSKLNSVVKQLLRKMKYDKYIPADEMMEDFARCRLPPYKIDRELFQNSIPEGSPPNVSSKVRLRFADRVCCIVKRDFAAMANGTGSDDESDGSSDDGVDESVGSPSILVQPKDDEMLFVFTSFLNNRRTHMMGQTAEDEVFCTPKFPKNFMDAINYLKSHCDRFVDVSQIPLDNKEQKESLIRSLWATHLLEVQPCKYRKAAKSARLH